MQEKRSKEEDERKAREEKEKRENVMIEIEKPSEGLCESRKNQSIVCLKILTKSVLLVECALNDFQTEYAPVLNALTNL